MSWLEAVAYDRLDRANGIRLPPRIATRRMVLAVDPAPPVVAASPARTVGYDGGHDQYVELRREVRRSRRSTRGLHAPCTAASQSEDTRDRPLPVPGPAPRSAARWSRASACRTRPAQRRTRRATRCVGGRVLVGGDGRLGTAAGRPPSTRRRRHGRTSRDPTRPATRAWCSTPPASTDVATGCVAAHDFFTPAAARSLSRCPRVVVLGTPPGATLDAGERDRPARARGLHPLARQGDRPRRHRPARLRRPGRRGPASASTLRFLLSPKSAYVSGQVVRVGTGGATDAPPADAGRARSTGKVALVTGASRGIGAAIARVLPATARRWSASTCPQAAGDLPA